MTVSWVWQKNMMYNKSGLAGDCRNNLQQRERNYSKLLAARSAIVTGVYCVSVPDLPLFLLISPRIQIVFLNCDAPRSWLRQVLMINAVNTSSLSIRIEQKKNLTTKKRSSRVRVSLSEFVVICKSRMLKH